ncbi:MAG: carbohydrate kinase family protein [Terriglobia bacterium]
MKIVSIGEVLWDVVGGEEHLGGAPLNFSVHASRLGHEVRLVSAVGCDPRGRRILDRMERLGLDTRYVLQVNDQPTGIVSVELDAARQPRFTIHRPAAYDFAELSVSQLQEIRAWQPDWIYFGTLFQSSRQGRELVRQIIAAHPASRCFYDVNLRKGCYTAALVRGLIAAADIVKLNEDEAAESGSMLGIASGPLENFCGALARDFGLDAVCVTRGPHGCVLLLAGEYEETEGRAVTVCDAIGAGDAFAAALLHGIGSGWPPPRVAAFANRVGALVASRPGAIPEWRFEEAEESYCGARAGEITDAGGQQKS